MRSTDTGAGRGSAPLMFVAAISISVVLPAGCAGLKNTGQQDYVWEMARICDARVAFWKMEQVNADSSYLIRGASNAPPGRDDYFACMQEQFAREPYGRWLALRSRAAAEGRPALAAGPTSSQHPQAVVVPIQIIDNVVLVPVVLGRSQGGTLLLDTGSQHTILTPEAAKRAGLIASTDTPTRAMYVTGGQRVDVPFVRLKVIEIGGAALDDVEVGIYPVAPQSPAIDGFLGANILDRFTVTVDSARKQLRLEPRR